MPRGEPYGRKKAKLVELEVDGRGGRAGHLMQFLAPLRGGRSGAADDVAARAPTCALPVEESGNGIVQAAMMVAEDDFYRHRGIKIHAVEVRSATCKDPATQHILQEILYLQNKKLKVLYLQEVDVVYYIL